MLIVARPPALIVPAAWVNDAAVTVRALVVSIMLSLSVTLPLAALRFNAPAALRVIGAPTFWTMSPAATIESALPLASAPAPVIVICPASPASKPVVVCTVTAALASAVLMLSQPKVEPDAVAGWNGEPPVTLVDDEPATIVKLVGSSNSMPAWPFGALPSTLASNTRLRLPETSAKPPLPSNAPPRTEIDP